MILSEKEMEKLIVDALAMEVWSTIKKRSVYQVRGDWGQGAKEAAHAIAKKLAEGVVVEARGVIRTTHEGHYALTIEHTYQGSGIGWATNAGSDVLDILRGDDAYQRVTVTVTKEEESGPSENL